ncbi:hypothetical protein [Streptomyces sp. NPDC042319]|uniref:hypothetical protein n=1 Tax=Streptomyces sp. NPDC042319 TaxID=3154332 RepID=UPI00340E2ED5
MSRTDISQPVPASPRGRRCRVLVARLRAALWRCVTLYGVDFGKGAARMVGGLVVTVACLFVLSMVLDVPFTVLIRAHFGL